MRVWALLRSASSLVHIVGSLKTVSVGILRKLQQCELETILYTKPSDCEGKTARVCPGDKSRSEKRQKFEFGQSPWCGLYK